MAQSRKRFHRDHWLGRRRTQNAEDKHSHRPTTHNTYKHRRPPNVVLVLAKKVKGVATASSWIDQAWPSHNPPVGGHNHYPTTPSLPQSSSYCLCFQAWPLPFCSPPPSSSARQNIPSLRSPPLPAAPTSSKPQRNASPLSPFLGLERSGKGAPLVTKQARPYMK